jgi:putative transposase
VPVGCHLDADSRRLRVMNVGLVKIIVHRPLVGTPKTATIQRSSTGKWYVAFSCACADPSPLPPTDQEVGIDVGLKSFATLTAGDPIENPHFFRQDERALAGAQRRLSRAEKGTPERAKRRHVVARIHERITWRRGDFAHRHSRRIVNTFDVIAVEDLSVNRMTHNHCLAKSLQDVAWSQFIAYLAHKAAWAGRRFIAVNPAHTSQDCSGCGHRHVLSLSDRVYTCPCCGLILDRDLNAARNILRLATAQLGLGQQSLASA